MPTPKEAARAAASTNERADQADSTDAILRALEPRANGLTADEIVASALMTSPALRKSVLDADKAAANRARAQLAFVPRIDTTAKYTRLSNVTFPPLRIGTMTVPNPFPKILDQYYMSASMKLPITDWFLTILPTYRGASLMADVSDQQRKAQELNVAYNARAAFFDYVRASGALIVAEDSVRLLERAVQDLESLVAAGTATQTDLLRARAQLSDARVFVTQVQGSVEVTLVRLAQLLGKPVDPTRGIGEPLIGVELGPTPELDKVLHEASVSRPELIALRTLERAREHMLSARKGAQYPQLSASGNVYYINPNPRITPQERKFNETWDVGVQLSWSPNDATYAHTQASDAEVEIAQVREDLRAMTDAIAVEAASAVTSHRTAAQDVAAKSENVQARRRFYEDQHALMVAGAATPNDVLIAETDLRRAELEWVDAFVQARLSQAALLKVQGKTGLANGAVTSRSKP